MRFQIKALNDANGIVRLELDAADEGEARRQARAGGFAVASLRRAAGMTFRVRRDTKFPLALFSQELLSLLEAGLTLVEAIDGLTEKEAVAATRDTMKQLRKQLHEGRTLSYAMQEAPGAFPPLFVATVRATERTGDLPDALRRYIAYQAQLDTVRKKVISASIYPVLLIIAGALVLLFLLGYVVPKFSHIYEDMHGDLPFLSRLLLQTGHVVESNGPVIFVVVAAMATALIRLFATPSLRLWIGTQLWKIPAFGERYRLYQLARFYRTLGMLLRGGTPIVSALDMAGGLLSVALRSRVTLTAQSIREGRSISDAMSEHDLTTPVALRMLRVGERSGRMDEMMERIAAFCDDEIARWVDWFTRLFEPLLMAFIGLVIGSIVVLMYLPVFELAGNIQ